MLEPLPDRVPTKLNPAGQLFCARLRVEARRNRRARGTALRIMTLTSDFGYDEVSQQVPRIRIGIEVPDYNWQKR
jgi:hypothetical protein